mgnify:CR=1 FL=1
MSLRRQFVLVFVTFAVVVSALGGGLAYRTAYGALERELDEKLTQVAGAVAEVGLRADEIVFYGPGDEDNQGWRAVRQQLLRLRSYVDEAYIVRPDRAGVAATAPLALVTTAPPDSIPVGAPVRVLAPYGPEIREATTVGSATSPLFRVEEEDRYYKYGFVRLEQTDAVLAVRMPADYMKPLEAFGRTVLMGSVLAAVMAALLAWFLATTVTGPLERLGRVALRIQRGRMDEEVRVERGGELGRLSRAMERMRRGILERDEQLRLMLAQVAHEIRNPLGGLELFASAAAETEDRAERTRLLGKIRGEIEELNRIIGDFLTFARPLRPEAGLTDARGPVREAVELTELEMKEGGGHLTVHLPDEPLPARVEEGHLKRIVLNLLRNAAQAGEHVTLTGEARRGEVVISVRDDGPGIPQEMREKVFDPFVTDKEKGAGLGLAIVKRLVEANGGRVKVDDGGGAIGEGAEFRVYFRGADDLPASPSER